MIEDGSKVRIHYTLKVDGNVIESSAGKDPLEYIHGEGQIVTGLEEELAGLTEGNKAEVLVPPEKGFGVVDPDAVHQVPRSALGDVKGLKVGEMLSGRVQGRPFQARVAEVAEESVTLDLNHPLAGKTLHFAVEIVGVE